MNQRWIDFFNLILGPLPERSFEGSNGSVYTGDMAQQCAEYLREPALDSFSMSMSRSRCAENSVMVSQELVQFL
jgi:hypothetical protein